MIIDPQNDFSDPLDTVDNNDTVKQKYEKYNSYYNGVTLNENGALGVPGSSLNYLNIINLINDVKFDEIHVSLDTHTVNHIGHYGFYKDKQDKLKQNSDVGAIVTKNKAEKDELQEYLDKYRELHFSRKGFHVQKWNTHCIESSEGHKIAGELQNALNGQKMVKYHIKGQNELSEMYSIFSATVQPSDVNKQLKEQLKKQVNLKDIKLIYSGNNNVKYDKEEGVDSYEIAAKAINLDVELNDGLLKKLFGKNNTIYVCGQARTHCVKDSILDMYNYANDNNIDLKRIVLLSDCTSGIPGFSFDTVKQANGIIEIKSTDVIKENKREDLLKEKLSEIQDKVLEEKIADTNTKLDITGGKRVSRRRRRRVTRRRKHRSNARLNRKKRKSSRKRKK